MVKCYPFYICTIWLLSLNCLLSFILFIILFLRFTQNYILQRFSVLFTINFENQDDVISKRKNSLFLSVFFLFFLFVWFFKPTFPNLSTLCVSKCLLTKLSGLFLAFPNYKSTPMFLIHMNHSCYPLPFYRETYFCLKDTSRANVFNSEYSDQASVLRRWYRIVTVNWTTVQTAVNWSIWLWLKGESNCSSSADNCQARMLAQRCLIFQFHGRNHENLDFFVF